MLLDLRTGFDQFDLVPSVLKSIDAVGYKEPTPIQGLVLPLMLDGVDVVEPVADRHG
jgi:ATP-dependent RNA helicase DeaD